MSYVVRNNTSSRVKLDSPIFAKQGDSGSPDRNGSAGPVDVPHCESHLGTLGKVRVLDWQPQPLVPAAQDGRREDEECRRKGRRVRGTEMQLLSKYLFVATAK